MLPATCTACQYNCVLPNTNTGLSGSSEQIVALCLDGSNITVQSNYIPEEGFVGRLAALCRHFCHKLHMKRLQLHRKLLQ